MQVITIHRKVTEVGTGTEFYEETTWVWVYGNAMDGLWGALGPWLDSEVQDYFKNLAGAATFTEVDQWGILSNNNAWVDSQSYMLEDGTFTYWHGAGGLDAEGLAEWVAAGGQILDDPASAETTLLIPNTYIPNGSPYFTDFYNIRGAEMSAQVIKVFYGVEAAI